MSASKRSMDFQKLFESVAQTSLGIYTFIEPLQVLLTEYQGTLHLEGTKMNLKIIQLMQLALEKNIIKVINFGGCEIPSEFENPIRTLYSEYEKIEFQLLSQKIIQTKQDVKNENTSVIANNSNFDKKERVEQQSLRINVESDFQVKPEEWINIDLAENLSKAVKEKDPKKIAQHIAELDKLPNTIKRNTINYLFLDKKFPIELNQYSKKIKEIENNMPLFSEIFNNIKNIKIINSFLRNIKKDKITSCQEFAKAHNLTFDKSNTKNPEVLILKEFIKKNKIDIDSYLPDKRTLLAQACLLVDVETCNILINELHASPIKRDGFGNTPLDSIHYGNNPDVEKIGLLLLNKGANSLSLTPKGSHHALGIGQKYMLSSFNQFTQKQFLQLEAQAKKNIESSKIIQYLRINHIVKEMGHALEFSAKIPFKHPQLGNNITIEAENHENYPALEILTNLLKDYKSSEKDQTTNTYFAEILDAFDKEKKYLQQDGQFTSTLLVDNFKKNKFVVIPTGWTQHSITVALYKNYLILSNHGENQRDSGLSIYPLKKGGIDKIDAKWIDSLVQIEFELEKSKNEDRNKKDEDENTTLVYEALKKVADFDNSILQFNLPGHRKNICTYGNAERAKRAMFSLLYLENNLKISCQDGKFYRINQKEPLEENELEILLEKAKEYASEVDININSYMRNLQISRRIEEMQYAPSDIQKIYMQLFLEYLVEHHGLSKPKMNSQETLDEIKFAKQILLSLNLKDRAELIQRLEKSGVKIARILELSQEAVITHYSEVSTGDGAKLLKEFSDFFKDPLKDNQVIVRPPSISSLPYEFATTQSIETHQVQLRNALNYYGTEKDIKIRAEDSGVQIALIAAKELGTIDLTGMTVTSNMMHFIVLLLDNDKSENRIKNINIKGADIKPELLSKLGEFKINIIMPNKSMSYK